MWKKLLGLGGSEAPVDRMAAPAGRSFEEVVAMDRRVDALARELPPEKGVLWAAKSAEMVRAALSPEDARAAQAAEAFARKPSPGLKEAALKAAGEVESPGPGALAAQAAGLAGQSELSPQASELLGPEAVAGLVNQAAAAVSSLVAGAVKLAAALLADAAKVAQAVMPLPKFDVNAPAPPEVPAVPQVDPGTVLSSVEALEQLDGEQLAKTADALKPFLELGEGIKSGAIS